MIVAIGMDPGPTPGLVKLTYALDQLMDVHVVQCTANAVLDILHAWCQDVPTKAELYFGVEKYVDKGRSAKAGQLTRDMVGSATTLVQSDLSMKGAPKGGVLSNPAIRVKAWATDNRLEVMGLLDATKGMTHARDAARHALFTATNAAGIPDPLSRKAVRRGR